MPSNWLVFDRIRALTRQHNIYQAERVYQDQAALDRLTAGGEFLDFNAQAAILDQTNLQINRLERYKDYEQMDQTGEISLALDLYCLSGNTRIPLLDGTCPTIRELTESGQQEFWLYGYDKETKLPKPVLGRNPHISGNNARMLRVEWDGGYIDCTPSHEFHTKRGWVAAAALVAGDSLTPYNHSVTAITPLDDYADTVYDLYVDDGHAFAAGTDTSYVLVHNSDEACLRGDTRIPLLDGTCPTISELAEKGIDNEFWVYAYDVHQGEYVPAKAHSARITGYNAQTVKVTFDDGESIYCTPDHLFLLNNGEWSRASDLRSGDSLKPLYKKRRYRTKNGSGYLDDPPTDVASEYDFLFDGQNFRSVHRWVFRHFNSDNPQIIHHDDYNGINNIPQNLIGMTVKEHDKIHRKYGADNHSFNNITLNDIKIIVNGWRGPMTKDLICQACDIGERVLYRILKENNLTWSEFKEDYHRCSCCNERISGLRWVCNECRQKYQRDYHQRMKNNEKYRERRLLNKRKAYIAVSTRVCQSCELKKDSSEFQRNRCAYSPYCNACRPHTAQSRYLRKSFKNHTVVSVEEYGVSDKVYDIEVPGYHCFAAGTQSSWVIVHNSLVDPERKHTLVIRARNRRLKKELEDLFFDTLLWDNYCRPSIRYLCKYGDLPFEVQPTVTRDGVASVRFMNVYNFTRIETRFGDLVGFFYQDALYPEPQFMHPWQVMHLRLTSFENIFHPYGRCVAPLTVVDTPNGPICIKNIQAGQEVYAWDGEKAVRTKILAKACSGKKRLWRIKTRHHELECTAEHPILIDGHGYKMAKDLRRGDRVIIPKIQNDNELTELKLPAAPNKNCKLPTLPQYIDTTFARLFGFLIGDGWATETSVEFALGEYQEVNEKYISILENYGLHYTERRNDVGKPIAAVFSSTIMAELMQSLGLIGKAHEKRIPIWVFKSPRHIKEAFLEGYTDADGCDYLDKGKYRRWYVVSSSRDLLIDFNSLIKRLGFKCGKVCGPIKNNDMICGKKVNSHDCYQMTFYKSARQSGCLTDIGALQGAIALNTGWAGALRSLGYRPHGSMYTLIKQRCQEYGVNTSHFKGVAWNKGNTAVLESPKVSSPEMHYITEQILSVEDTGRIEKVYDIQVDGYHNFLADGVVVHNSILDGGRKAFKQLRLMEDAALIYRITRAPEKRKFTIPVGLIPPKEVPEYMQMIARNFKRQRFYNPTTGAFDERYSPLIQEDDFFLPRRPDGTGPDVDTLPGAENLDQIADIEYFKKKMIAPTKIPFARVGIGEGAGEASEKSLSQSHSEFAKAVQWVQREMATGLTKIAIIHLALRGYSVEDLKGFEIALTATSAMEELYRIETWQTRVGVMADLKDLGWFPKEWIVTHFTDLSPDEIEELKDMESEEGAGGPSGGGPGGLDLEPEMAEGEEGGEEGLDLGGEEAEAAAEEEEGLSFEGYDRSAERRLLHTMKRNGDIQGMMKHVRKWADRLGKPDDPNVRRFDSGYTSLMENKEFDGLSRAEPPQLPANRVYNPNNDSKDALLVEWSIDQDERDEAISEVYNVITGDDGEYSDDTDEITEQDLPKSKVSNL